VSIQNKLANLERARQSSIDAEPNRRDWAEFAVAFANHSSDNLDLMRRAAREAEKLGADPRDARSIFFAIGDDEDREDNGLFLAVARFIQAERIAPPETSVMWIRPIPEHDNRPFFWRTPDPHCRNPFAVMFIARGGTRNDDESETAT
jgi:hypothetical protein